MSKTVTALNGASFSGEIEIQDKGLIGMITLRGDLGSAAFAKAVKSVVGTKIPDPLCVEVSTKGTTLWMSPDELLLLVEYDQSNDVVAKLEKSLKKEHHLAVNVSDARAVFDLSGDCLRDILAKGAPTDISADAMPVHQIRRTRIGQLPVAFWFSNPTTAHLICFRSVGAHMFEWLKSAAKKGTSPDYSA